MIKIKSLILLLFIKMAFLETGVKPDFGKLGRFTDNALIESFNGRFRAEYLQGSWFLSVNDAW